MNWRTPARGRRTRLLLSLGLAGLLSTRLFGAAQVEDRLGIEAKINNQPVRLAFDTGSECSALFRGASERLGLKIAKTWDKEHPLAPGKVPMDLAEECTLDIGSGPQKFRFWVIDGPRDIPSDIDGFVSWNDTRNYVIEIDGEKPDWGLLEELPKDLKGWTKWKIVPDSEYLVFDCSNDMQSARIEIDTGSTGGVELSPRRWQTWRAERAGKPATMSADIHPSDGMVVREMLRARKLRIGGLDLVDVPVTVATPSANILCGYCDATLGLHVVRQMKLLIDAKHGALYLRNASPPADQYGYNQLGAVFVPRDLQSGDDLVGHVMKDGPAYRAGIRDGDLLLKIGILNVTVWRTDPYILPIGRFWIHQPIGSKVKLTLKRNDQQYETTVTLEELPAVD